MPDKIKGQNFFRITIREIPYGIPMYGEECTNLWVYDSDGRLVVKAHRETGSHQLDNLYGKFSGCYEVVDDLIPGDEVMWFDENSKLRKGNVIEEGEVLPELWGKMELQLSSFSPISKNYNRIYRREPAEDASINFMSMDKAELDSMFVKVDYQDRILYIPKLKALKGRYQIPDIKYQISDIRYQIPDIKYHESENQISDFRYQISDIKYQLSDGNNDRFIFEVETFYMNGREIIKHQHYPNIRIEYRSKTYFPTENEALEFMANPPEVFPRESETIYCHFLRRFLTGTVIEDSGVETERFPNYGDFAVGDIVEYFDGESDVQLCIVKHKSESDGFTLLNFKGDIFTDVPSLFLAKPRFRILKGLQRRLQSFF